PAPGGASAPLTGLRLAPAADAAGRVKSRRPDWLNVKPHAAFQCEALSSGSPPGRALWGRREVVEQSVRVGLRPDAHGAGTGKRAVVRVDQLRAVPVHFHMITLELGAQFVPGA